MTLDDEVVFGEVTLHRDGRHAPRSGRRDRLTIFLIVKIPRGEDTFDGRLRTLVHDDVSALIELNLAVEDRAVRGVPDAVKQSLHLESALISGFRIPKFKTS